MRQAEEEAREFREVHVVDAKNALERAQRRFEAEKEEGFQQLKRAQRKASRRERKNSRRNQALNERETLLQKAAAAVEKLEKKTERELEAAQSLEKRAKQRLAEAADLEESLAESEARLGARERALKSKHAKLDDAIANQVVRLEELGGLTAEKAQAELKSLLLERTEREAARDIHKIEQEAERRARERAQRIVLTTIQRTASSITAGNSASVVHLESDKQKGLIIGRMGRNIQAFTTASGTEVTVDDTPGVVVISCFEPVQREIARRALQALVSDGRIHPGTIERQIKVAKASVEEELIETGERTAIDLHIHGMHEELLRWIGRMRYRTSYGQNLLAHSHETARIASMIAAELGLDPKKARRAGLLHDIGKVDTESADQPHALVGMKLCERYGEDPAVSNAVGAHHDEIEMASLIAPIVQAADAISASRPGARRPTHDLLIERLQELERVARDHDGVDEVFVFHAGREVRVIVDHAQVDDVVASTLAKKISRRIEDELKYPGQVKVTVIREVRASSVAR